MMAIENDSYTFFFERIVEKTIGKKMSKMRLRKDKK